MADEAVQEQTAEVSEGEQNTETSADEGGKETPDYKAKSSAMEARYKEERAKRIAIEEKLAKVSPKEEKSVDIPVKQMLNLRKDGFSDEEILELTDQAHAMGVTADKLLANPLFKAGIEAKREKALREKSVPTPSHRTVTVEGKTWDKMNEAERKANFKSFASQFIK